MRLDQLLAKSGLGSRRDAKRMVRAGRVKVCGQVARDPGMHVLAGRETVTVDGREVSAPGHVYLMLNKPPGVVSSTRDNRHATVLDLVPSRHRHPRLFPVGRLDLDTEGLQLITSDGQLAHRLLAPKHHVAKVYHVLIDDMMDTADVGLFAKGITLADGTVTRPAHVKVLEPGRPCLVALTIREGKYHQVKRMFRATGKTVLRLKRVAMGGVELDPDLAPGEVRELTAEEVGLLRQAAGGEADD